MGLRGIDMSERGAALRHIVTLPPFENAEAEASFWQERDARLYHFRRWMLLAGIFAFWIFIVVDLLIATHNLQVILTIRCVTTVAILGLYVLFCRNRASPMQREAILGVTGIVTVLANLIMAGVAGPPLADVLPFSLGMIMAFGVGLVSPRFVTTVWAGLVGYALFWISVPFLQSSFAAIITNAHFLTISIFAALVGTFAREKLEREHADSTRRLIALNLTATEAGLAKDRLLASVSHELRTPVNAIVGFSEVMRQGMFGAVEPPRYRQYVDDIGFSAQLLRTGIDDLLEVSRLGAQKFAWQDTHSSLAQIVEASVALCDQVARNAEVKLRLVPGNGQIVIRTDPQRLTQVLVNVITNATKFSDRGGLVVVEIREMPDRGVRVTIADTGCGIAPEDLDRIREPFAQGHTDHYSAHKGGLGLGLSIANTLMQKMDGRLDIESHPGEGTIVSIVLPSHRITTDNAVPRSNAARADRAEPA